jgi:hypothetical protein
VSRNTVARRAPGHDERVKKDQQEEIMIVIFITLTVELCLAFIAWVRP